MLPVKGINSINKTSRPAVDCLPMITIRCRKMIRVTIEVKLRWGHRDLNPARRVSSSEPLLRFASLAEKSRVGAPVGHQLSANPLVVIPVQLEPAVLPSYTIPPMFALRKDQPFAWRRARRRLRNFFLRHFQR